MPKAAFTTLGCKVNQYETQKILESFETAGFEVVPFGAEADVVVVNTCSVTGDAERKSRYTLRRAVRAGSDTKVVATGCAVQMALNKNAEMDSAHLLIPHASKLKTLELVLEAFPNLAPTPVATPVRHQGRTRATLKIQDGCNAMCSYCSIPYTRPGMSSRPWQEVLAEAQGLAAMGYHEAVLTGVLIGAYGPETGSGGLDFVELVELLARESGLARLRISSIEMHQVSDPIIRLAVQGHIVPHFHIPLQSGDTGVLRDMNRSYSQDDYIALCKRLQREIKDVSLTTDVLVGFPTEDARAFESSCQVFREVGFHSAHVFSFSPRPGTPADQWGDPVSPEEKARRRTVLMEIASESGQAHRRRFLGRTLRVLFEGKQDRNGLLQGLTDNYLTVRSAAPLAMARTLQWVRIEEEVGGALVGEVVAAPVLSLI